MTNYDIFEDVLEYGRFYVGVELRRMRLRGLDDEWRGKLLCDLYKAYKNYHEILDKLSLKKLLKWAVRVSIIESKRRAMADMRHGYTFSYDRDCIISTPSTEDKVIITELVNMLDEDDQYIVEKRLEGYTYKQIGDTLGNTKQWAERRWREVIIPTLKHKVS